MESNLFRLHEVITDTVRDTTFEELACQAEGKWSIGQILEHLYLSYTGTVRGFAKCLQMGMPIVSSSTVKQRVAAFLITRIGYFPSGRKSPKQAQPCGVDPHTVMREIGHEIEKMDAVITECEAQFGRGPVLDHPLLGPLSAAQWRKLHRLHARHHLRQIAKLKEEYGAKAKPSTEAEGSK